jgi:pullulanase
MRDGIKGSVFIANESGFINGGLSKDESVKFGIVGSVFHPQIDISKVDYSDEFWANSPMQTVNYASAHDNLTLWDKLLETNSNYTVNQLKQLNKLSAAIVLTSQGIPFFQAGEEIARTKGGNENSYKSSDTVNRIDWNRKNEFMELNEYYKGLIDFRKSNDAFRLTEASDVENNIKFLKTEQGLIAYLLKNNSTTNTEYDEFLIILNATDSDKIFSLKKEASIFINENYAGTNVIENVNGQVTTKSKSAYVLGLKKGTQVGVSEVSVQYLATSLKDKVTKPIKKKLKPQNNIKAPILIGVSMSAITALVIGVGVLLIQNRKKK